jgi:hypothetical protein
MMLVDVLCRQHDGTSRPQTGPFFRVMPRPRTALALLLASAAVQPVSAFAQFLPCEIVVAIVAIVGLAATGWALAPMVLG